MIIIGVFSRVFFSWVNSLLNILLSPAFHDVKDGFLRSRYWFFVAWQDIKQRYKRSFLGPFWITISTGLMIAAMGPLYSKLFAVNNFNYAQYIGLSFVFWTFISASINDACTVFINSEIYIKQVKLPFSGYVLKILFKNISFLMHNFLIVIIILVIYKPLGYSQLFLFPFAFLIVFFNLFFLVLILGMLCARFRDVTQLVANIVQVLFFITPIMWKPEMLSQDAHLIIEMNPIYHLIEILRFTLVGSSSNISVSFFYCVILLVLNAICSMILFSKYRSRIAYWV